jgi:hypothetical protein
MPIKDVLLPLVGDAGAAGDCHRTATVRGYDVALGRPVAPQRRWKFMHAGRRQPDD